MQCLAVDAMAGATQVSMAMAAAPLMRLGPTEPCSWRPAVLLLNKGRRINMSCSVSYHMRKRLTAPLRPLWRCMATSGGPDGAGPFGSKDESTGTELDGTTQSSKVAASKPPPPEGPNKSGNRIIALVSAAAAVCLFFANRGVIGIGPTLSELTANAVPYEEALSNGKPTVVEFYADWCEVCREMVRDVYSVEEQYKDRVNFVMVNVDNSKWEAELDEFGVEGIPHFAFLDGRGNEEGNIVGRLPKKYLLENVDALAKGESKVPHSRVVGQFSGADSNSKQAPKLVSPRSHG